LANDMPKPALLLMAITLAAGQARAADDMVQLGLELYRHGDFKGCIISLSRALDRGISNDDDVVAALTYLASAYEARNDLQATRRTLKQLLMSHRDLTFDPALFPPSFLHIVAQVKHNLPAEAVASPGAPAPPVAASSLAPLTPAQPQNSVAASLTASPAAAPPKRPVGIYLLAGGSAAALAAAAVVGSVSWSLRSQDHTAQVGGVTTHTITYSQASAANRDATVAYALTGVGAGLLGAAVVWECVR
jgi:hypothetical protein